MRTPTPEQASDPDYWRRKCEKLKEKIQDIYESEVAFAKPSSKRWCDSEEYIYVDFDLNCSQIEATLQKSCGKNYDTYKLVKRAEDR